MTETHEMELLFSASWSEHEEGEKVELFYRDGRYFAHHEGHRIYVGDFDETEEVSEREAMAIIEDRCDWPDIEI